MGTTRSGLSDRQRRRLGRLLRRKDREREGRVLVAGVRAVQEVLTADAVVHLIVTAPRLAEVPGGAALAQALTRLGAESVEVADRTLAALSGMESTQGVLIVAEEPQAPGLDRLAKGHTMQVVLDGVQDPSNVGALIRSAVAFGWSPTVLSGSADPWSAKAVRASAGTVFRQPPARATHEAWLEWVGGQEQLPWLADASGPSLDDLRNEPRGSALIIGNEGNGVSDAIRRAPHRAVSVPLAQGVESLNAAVAGAVLMYALNRHNDE